MKRKIRVVIVSAFFGILLAGCKENQLNGGNCSFSVGFQELPQEMLMLEENVHSRMEIVVHLKSDKDKKNYNIVLNADNNYKQTAYLKEGTYKIKDCMVQPKGLVELRVGVSQKEITLSPQKAYEAELKIKNQDEFNDWVWNMQMKRKTGQMDAFSRKVQLDGKIIKLKKIRKAVGFSRDAKVKPEKKATLKNKDEQIEIVVQNDSDIEKPWTSCRIERVTFKKNNVIVGGGGRIGMSPYDIVNCEKGLYRTPDFMRGAALLGEDFEGASAVYENKKTGDRLSFKISADGTYISQITYEFGTGKKAGGKA